MSREFNVNGHLFEVRPRTLALGAESSLNLKKLGITMNAEAAQHETTLQMAELGRLVLVRWVRPDGTEPMKDLNPSKAREYLKEHGGALVAILKLAGRLSDEDAAEFEVDSGN